MSTIKIFLNGDTKEIKQNLTLTDLLKDLEITSKHIAIELNDEVVFKSDWNSRILVSEDKLEVVKAIGGG
tara:strand:+ start:3592 stop:3801 length:210 start_codon:yes stop_codon:yes gene_type:complete